MWLVSLFNFCTIAFNFRIVSLKLCLMCSFFLLLIVKAKDLLGTKKPVFLQMSNLVNMVMRQINCPEMKRVYIDLMKCSQVFLLVMQ
jgi:hypothetical protein